MWCEEDLEAKIKLIYYKEVINPTLEDQNYLFVLTSSKKKINIVKIRAKSHEIHSETWCWIISKTPRAKRFCHLCKTMSVEYENSFLLELSSYAHINEHFYHICNISDIYNLKSFCNFLLL